MKLLILLYLSIFTLSCTSYFINSKSTDYSPIRTVIYEDDIVSASISMKEVVYTLKDTVYINVKIKNKLPNPIFIPTRFHKAEILIPENMSRFGIDLGMGGYFDSDPLLSMKAISFTKVSRKAERKISIPISKLWIDQKSGHQKYFDISVFLALIENMNELENFVNSDNPDLLSEEQFIIFSNRVREIRIGSLETMIELKKVTK